MVTRHRRPPFEKHPPQENEYSTKPSEGRECVYRSISRIPKGD